ncbi:MAG TPA: hypothetical protein VMY35_17355 [Phycisphaerae bacterium]|nr:hypothetical protein [Thermoguttaceae bacterium]HUX02732.1 hypothetical protein [Phycisphaerae bacterium]
MALYTVRIGLDCKFYRGPAGALASLEVKNVKELTLVLELTEEEATTREAEGWEMTEPILFRSSLEWTMNWKPSDTNFAAFKTAFFAKAAIALAALDGPGGEGLDADYKMFRFTRAEPKGIVTVSCLAKPVFVSRAPKWKS